MDYKLSRNPKCTNVLVIEDNDEAREAMEMVLRDDGYRVYGVKNGREALLALKKIPGRSLILLDMLTPVMSGWDFFKAQATDSVIAGLPVVVVSALGASAVLADRSSALPAVGYLKKPVSLDGLLDIVGRYCERQEILAAAS